MSILADHFVNIIQDVKDREAKLSAISDDLTALFEHMQDNPGTDYLGKTLSFEIDSEGTVTSPASYKIIEARGFVSDIEHAKLSVFLTSSGNATVTMSGAELAETTKQHFDMDAYSAAGVVGKIITTLQDHTNETFGAHITQTLETIWSTDLGQSSESAPGRTGGPH